MLRVRTLAGLAVFGLLSAAHADPIKRTVQPGISPDGSKIAFSYQGDIWVVGSAGGTATRLTVHPARDTQPRFTPDGKSIVFASDRFGSNDFYIMGANGSGIRRLNYESSLETLYTLSPDGKYALGYSNQWGRSDIIRVPLAGGDSVRMSGHPLEMEYYPSVSPDGTKIVYNSGSSGGSWRKIAGTGSNTSEIFVGDNTVPIRNIKRITTNEFHDFFPLVSPDNKITFISNRSGWPNLWRMNMDGSGATKLTDFSKAAVRWPSMSGDGKKVAFEFDSEIWVYDSDKKAATKVTIDAPLDNRINSELTTAITQGVANYAVSPDGKRIVVEARGELWLIPAAGGTTRRLSSSVAYDGQPQWLDNDRIVFATGRTGRRTLMTVTIKGEEKPFYSHPTHDVGNPKISPDGKLLAFYQGDNDIVTLNADGRGTAKSVLNGWFSGGLIGQDEFSWSPDSKWIAAGVPTERGSTKIVLAPVEGGQSLTVATAPRDIGAIKWLPNGKGIYYFGVAREDANLFLIDLVAPEIKFTEDDLESLEAPKAEEPKAPATPVVKVDMRGIERRVRQLTRDGAASAIASADSRTLYITTGTGVITYAVATGQTSPSALAPFTNATMDKQGRLYTVAQGRLNLMNPTGPLTPLSMNGTLNLNLKDEESALFNEIWWTMGKYFYDPNMHGKDWVGIKNRYAQVVPHTTDRSDFYALMGEMLEELNSSHQGTTAPPEGQNPVSEPTGFLGVEWNWTELAATGKYVVASVLEGTPASHPMMELKPGDVVMAVNGVNVGPGNPIAKSLNGTWGKKVRLKVMRDGKETEVVIRPVNPSTVTGTLYDNYVAWNRAFVDKISGGKLAYHHYESMDADSQEKFLAEVRTLTEGKKGLIIDVRFNGGGFTAHQALGVLIKTPWLIRTRRDAPSLRLSENIYRGDTLELPSVLMTNQYSFSNAEIFSEGFRRLKIGPVVGERTAGGVIGTSAIGMWDGGSIRMPASGAYTVDGENLENNGRRADVDVRWDQNAWLEGRDVQLEAAVRELMKRIK